MNDGEICSITAYLTTLSLLYCHIFFSSGSLWVYIDTGSVTTIIILVFVRQL
ncbi:hypothetical protein EV127DRAFT_446430 [Xylaria flabelliformis]|nr:hypothetical protein EV127DRAFT_446430 [Xylaria flabelliformis]